MIANLKHAARNHETVIIGGGEFGPEELSQAVRQLESHADLLEALRSIEEVLKGNKLAAVGNSTVHYALMKARGAIAKATGENQ